MSVGNGEIALYAPLVTNASSPGASLNQVVSAMAGWWDASTPAGLLGSGNVPASTWGMAGTALVDLSGNNQPLPPFYSPSNTLAPQGAPHLSGVLGGVGFPASGSGLLVPALDPSSGWQVSASTASAGTAWSFYLVWSRPNWRQGTNINDNPITLLTIGSQPILQVDSSGGSNRLVLFPGTGQVVVSTSMARRHTHSIVLTFSPSTGANLWLDSTQVAQAVAWSPGTLSGPVLFLHDGTGYGAAQCWLHEAAVWNQLLSTTEASAIASYAGRWVRGSRKGLYLIFNGQSNAINYSMNDGAAALLAEGLGWYLGALAYNVLATTGAATSYTMESGNGIYATSSGYPGSFVQNPGDGSLPSTWSLGADGLAVQQAIEALPAEDVSDMCAIIWPWNETDSLRQYSELSTFQAAAERFLSLLRPMLGDTANKIPLVWWNGIPYGTNDGITMHRQAVQNIVGQTSQNVIVGNPQTSDSNPRGSSWDPTTGIATGGDASHRDSADNQRFAMLASPVIANTLVAQGYGDSITALPAGLPQMGGPKISHVYQQSSTSLIVTVVHDAGTDLIVPLQAAVGAGFAVMDGGSPGNDGTIVTATACQRIDATHLQITLATALQNPPGACALYYPFGPQQIYRGNAVTDNFSTLTPPAGWNPGRDLGSGWTLNFPLAATFTGIPLSSTPA